MFLHFIHGLYNGIQQRLRDTMKDGSLILFFFFFLLYVNSSEKKPSFSFYPNIHYYICWRVSTKQKQKQILPSLYDGNVLSRVLRLFFSSPPTPFCFSLCFFSVTSGTQHACYFHSDDASR